MVTFELTGAVLDEMLYAMVIASERPEMQRQRIGLVDEVRLPHRKSSLLTTYRTCVKLL